MYEKKRSPSPLLSFHLSKKILLRLSECKRSGGSRRLKGLSIMKRRIASAVTVSDEQCQRGDDKTRRGEKMTRKLLQNSNKTLLSEDTMQEIFLRLPIKSLLRCKCLSKSSYSLLSAAPFHEMYVSRRRNASSLMLGFFYQPVDFNDCYPVPIQFKFCSFEAMEDIDKILGLPNVDLSLSFLMPQGRGTLYIVASSNGFILCSKKGYRCDLYYYVCNPITRQWVALPSPPKAELSVRRVETLVFHATSNYPCLEWVTYKVVRCLEIESHCLDVEIFSSETGKWVEMQLGGKGSYYLRLPILDGPGAISKSGTVCLAAVKATDDACILAFNVNENSKHLQIVKHPGPEFDIDTTNTWLGESQGVIQVAMYQRNCHGNLEIWYLSEDCQPEMKWFLKFRVNMTEMFPGCTHLYFIAFYQFDPLVILIFHNEMTMLFDLTNKSLKFSWKSKDFVEVDWFFFVPYQLPCY